MDRSEKRGEYNSLATHQQQQPRDVEDSSLDLESNDSGQGGEGGDGEGGIQLVLHHPEEVQVLEEMKMEQISLENPQDNSNNKNKNTNENDKTENHPINWNLKVLLSLYLDKFKGVSGKKPPAMTKPLEMMASSILAFIGIFLVSVTDFFYLYDNYDVDHLGIKLLTGAYAASSVLLYEAYQSPLAQPRNVLGSYAVASFIGVSVRKICDIIGIPRYVTGALAVCFAILGMNLTKTVHPPGGACALISVIGGPMIEKMGYGYIATSIGAAFIMVAWAVIGNNLIPTRQYPLYWY